MSGSASPFAATLSTPQGAARPTATASRIPCTSRSTPPAATLDRWVGRDDAEEAWTAFRGGPSGDLVVTGETPEGRFVRAFCPRRHGPLDPRARHLGSLPRAPRDRADESVVFAGPSLAGPRALIQGLTSAGEPAFLAEARTCPSRQRDAPRRPRLWPGLPCRCRCRGAQGDWAAPAGSPDCPLLHRTADHRRHHRRTTVPDSVLECAQPAPCGRVEAFAGCPGDPTPAAYTAAQTCALEAFAAGRPGPHRPVRRLRLRLWQAAAGLAMTRA